jgi:AcrR family transcriptional regulator
VPPDPTERTRIMDAAYRVLAVDPNRPLSVTDVLAEAGLSTRAFYRHFESKDTLLVALFRRDAERLNAQLRTAVAAAPTPRAALLSWIEGYLGVVSDPRRRRRVGVFNAEVVAGARGIGAERQRIQEERIESLLQILTAGRDDGSFPWAVIPGDARAIRSVLGDALTDQIAGVATVPPAQAAAEIADFALRALGAARPIPDAAPQGPAEEPPSAAAEG